MKKIVFYVESSSWQPPAFLAFLLFISSNVFKFHDYYIPSYLLAASFISYLLYFRKYGIITDSSLILYFGFFLNNKIVLNLNEVESVNTEMFKYEGFLSRQRHVYNIETIAINLQSPINKNVITKITGGKQKRIIHREVELTEEGTKLILYRPPSGGFQRILQKIPHSISSPKTVKVDKDDEDNFAKMFLVFLSMIIFAGFIVIYFYFSQDS